MKNGMMTLDAMTVAPARYLAANCLFLEMPSEY